MNVHIHTHIHTRERERREGAIEKQERLNIKRTNE